jgi:hypothetical protein
MDGSYEAMVAEDIISLTNSFQFFECHFSRRLNDKSNPCFGKFRLQM